MHRCTRHVPPDTINTVFVCKLHASALWGRYTLKLQLPGKLTTSRARKIPNVNSIDHRGARRER